MLESTIEKYLVAAVERRGGFTVKLNPAGKKGIPDRLVVLPDGVLIFAELKRPKGGIVAQLQDWWRNRIRHLGHRAVVLSTQEEVDHVLTSPPAR